MRDLTRPQWVAPALAVAACGLSLQMAGDRLAGSDAGALATAAAKILDGGVFYRDIDSYPFPGAAYLLALAMQLFGETLTVARVLATVLFVGTVLGLYSVALRLLGAARAATFGASLLAFKLIAWPSFTAYTYWDVALAFGCLAGAALVGHQPGRPTAALVVAGLATGAAVTAKQSLGIPLAAATLAVLGLRAGISQISWKELGAYGSAAAAPFLVMAAYFAAHGLLGPMIESGLLRPFSDYLPTSSTSFVVPLLWWQFGELRALAGLAWSSEPLWAMGMHGDLPAGLTSVLWFASELLSRVVYTSVPLVFALAAWRWAKQLRGPSSEATDAAPWSGWPFFAFAPLAAAIFVSAFPRADFGHVISVYPVVLLLLFALVPRKSRTSPSSGVEKAAVALVLAVCLTLALAHQTRLSHEMRLDRAHLSITPDKAWIESAARYVADEIPPGEPFFVYGHEAYYYFLADRYSPWRYSQLYPGQDGGDGGEAIVAALAARPPKLILRGAIRFPRATPIPEYLPKLDAWIRSHYRPDSGVFDRYPPVGRLPRERQFQMLRLARDPEVAS